MGGMPCSPAAAVAAAALRSLQATGGVKPVSPPIVDDPKPVAAHEEPQPLDVSIKRSAPSPPPVQDEPMDFSTTKKDAPIKAKSTPANAPFTSSRELKFARNLKLILMEVFRTNPEKGRMIIDFMRSVAKVRSQAMGNHDGGGGYTSHGHSSGGGSGTSSPNQGSPAGSDVSSNLNNNGKSNNNNNTLDLDSIDFTEAIMSGGSGQNATKTAKWFAEHSDLNPSKAFDGINLKTEFPYPNTAEAVKKPPDFTSLDNATANLLQMSVPDPSTTFLDIGGTDSSMYEDDPFKIEDLLPSNFNMGQLEQHVNINHGPAHGHAHDFRASSSASSSSSGHSPTPSAATALPTPHQTAAAVIGMSLYPETTISLQGQPPHQPQSQPQPLHAVKSEPVAFIKREEVDSPDEGHAHSIASLGGTSSYPGPLPHRLVGPPHVPPQPHHLPQPHGIQPQQPGGGKMKSSAGPGRKRQTSMSGSGNGVSAEEEELTNVPSLQMRIKILQSRVSF